MNNLLTVIKFEYLIGILCDGKEIFHYLFVAEITVTICEVKIEFSRGLI